MRCIMEPCSLFQLFESAAVGTLPLTGAKLRSNASISPVSLSPQALRHQLDALFNCPLADRGTTMEEAELLKERLQAITEKRKIQVDISRKRTKIDEEKLKLQYLKKKALREQWLQDGLSVQSSQELEARRLQAQGHQQQAKLLQINIQRMEQEIEALERQEMVISRNEGFILQRLKAIEKSPQDIIKEANTDGKKEPVLCIYSANSDIPKSYNSSILKKQKSPDLETKDQPKKQ
ncbi:hypothetical protein SKAU_G00199700 [Synaphobranchus kaupii]|uniref:Palmdelphin n=1 Tax=Synaphobranchus kaupii TaxID=118154 RepID=A0A9Q1IXQ5_SYNKA|nr:hypothetical protein SKAU_G00199700 [Synaphobranchus kaupii]